MSTATNLWKTGRLLGMLAGAFLLLGNRAQAQDDYRIGEKELPQTTDRPAESRSKSATVTGHRVARFEYVSGNITWRAGEGASWTKASKNTPVREGAQVWATDGGRAEIRFDDGSLLRVGNGTVVTLETLFSDDKGEYTQLRMISGIATLRLTQSYSIYEVQTPSASIKAAGPGRVRIGVAQTVEVGVSEGRATVDGKQGKKTLYAGDFLDLRDADAAYHVSNLPREDSWERWNDERDHLQTAKAEPVHRYYPDYYPVYYPYYPYYPGSSVWLSFDFPLGRSHYGHWGGYRRRW